MIGYSVNISYITGPKMISSRCIFSACLCLFLFRIFVAITTVVVYKGEHCLTISYYSVKEERALQRANSEGRTKSIYAFIFLSHGRYGKRAKGSNFKGLAELFQTNLFSSCRN